MDGQSLFQGRGKIIIGVEKHTFGSRWFCARPRKDNRASLTGPRAPTLRKRKPPLVQNVLLIERDPASPLTMGGAEAWKKRRRG